MTEIERAVQVAETWGQRVVMEPVENEKRLDDFNAKKALFHCVSQHVENRCAPCRTKNVLRLVKFRAANNSDAGWMS